MCPESILALSTKPLGPYLPRCASYPLRLYNLREASEILRIAPCTLRALSKQHNIDPIRVGAGRPFYTDEMLLEVIEARCPTLTDKQRSNIASRLGIVCKKRREEKDKESLPSTEVT
jgi:uncharacterized Fe-S cluster-containing radical SAM superfamily protein